MARGKKTMAAAVQTNAVQAKAAEVKTAPEMCVKAVEVSAKAAEVSVKEAEAAKAAETVKTAETVKAAETAQEAETKVRSEAKKSVIVEFGGRQIMAKDVLAQAEKEYAEANPGIEIKTLELYICPEQNAAYYVVNGEGSADYRIQL